VRKRIQDFRALMRRYRDDERGVISILGAFLILLGLGLSVMVIDVGHLYLAKRRLQAMVDAAALAAAADPATAAAIAQTMLGRNGYATDRIEVQAGLYTADPALPLASRLDVSSSLPNAVRVTDTITVPDFLAMVFNDAGKADIQATATAAQSPSVSFAAGSGLAQLSGGTLNGVLGKMLGTNLSLSALNWQGLAHTNVDALTFLDQLAARAGVAGGTYGDLANTNVTIGQVILAAQAALNIHPQGVDSAALDALNLLSLQMPQAVSATLGAVVDTALWKTRNIGSIIRQDQGQTTINLLDAVTAMARLYGGGHLADVGANLSVPVTGTSIAAFVTAGQPLASAAVAHVGDGVSTSQVRLALTVTAASVNLGVATAKVVLPVYVEVASGTATVSAIPCRDDSMAVIAAAPTAATVQIGTVTAAQLQDFTTTVQPSQAAVVQLTVLGIPIAISASGSSSLVQTTNPPGLTFTRNDIQTGIFHSAAGSDGGHLLSGVADHLTLSVGGSGITGLVSSLVNGTVMPILRPLLVSILSSLDPTVDALLQTLGVKLGTLDVTVHGVACGRATIVG
jgi:uncharacterized membrane protein